MNPLFLLKIMIECWSLSSIVTFYYVRGKDQNNHLNIHINNIYLYTYGIVFDPSKQYFMNNRRKYLIHSKNKFILVLKNDTKRNKISRAPTLEWSQLMTDAWELSKSLKAPRAEFYETTLNKVSFSGTKQRYYEFTFH